MVVFQIDTNEEQISKILKQLDGDAERALKNAINATARKVKKDMAKTAEKKYDYEAGGTLINEMKMNTAKKVAYGSMAAEISSKGPAIEIKKFSVDNLSVTKGKNRPDAVRGKVMTESGMSALKRNGVKAFVAQFRSGHISVVAREKLTSGQQSRGHHSGNRYKYASYRLKKLLSPSVPQMLGNKKTVNEIIEPEIQSLLQKNLERQLNMIMKKKAV